MELRSHTQFFYFCLKGIPAIIIPNIEDKQIIGKWKSVAYIEKFEDFENENFDKDLRLWLEEVKFIKGGKVIRKYFDTTWEDLWTKGKWATVFMAECLQRITCLKKIKKLINNLI